ncbi:hypothetical protein SBRY_40081 [Actinacidiphila bryophytorum]|uniref:Uncharacterized protein n=1 Tax=Actinacidiphila bryophytorum TaxID=1436133 RepID=A0A9W4MAT6_9ACTN|nr:hypothetical protein SBRY_40081 [Actinacidiphila bryophytorum]
MEAHHRSTPLHDDGGTDDERDGRRRDDPGQRPGPRGDGAGPGRRLTPAVPPLPAGLPVGRAARPEAGAALRPRTALRGRNVPRPRPDPALPPHRPALRDRRRRRGPPLPGRPRDHGRGGRPGLDGHRPAHHTRDPPPHGPRGRPGHPRGRVRRPRHRLRLPPRWRARRRRGRPPPPRLQEAGPGRLHRGHPGPPVHHVRQRQGRRPGALRARLRPHRLRRRHHRLPLAGMTAQSLVRRGTLWFTPLPRAGRGPRGHRGVGG